MKFTTLVFASTILFCSCSSDKQKEAPEWMKLDSTIDNTANVSENAPADRVITASGAEVKTIIEQIEEVSVEARKTLPEAKSRFFKGLPKGEAFFLTINLKEGNAIERVFVRVTKWKDKAIAGNIANDIVGLQTYKNGQEITFSEEDVMDWTITKPDGSEEGNYIGKFLDSQQ